MTKSDNKHIHSVYYVIYEKALISGKYYITFSFIFTKKITEVAEL